MSLNDNAWGSTAKTCRVHFSVVRYSLMTGGEGMLQTQCN